MSFVMIPEELLDVNMSAAQFRALINIIHNTYSNGKYAGCCCLGYQNLAKLCFTNKPVMIKIVQQLEKMGFVEINRREKFNRSNAIKLTLESGLERCGSDIGESLPQTHTLINERYLKDTDKRYLKDTDERYLKNTEGYLKDTEGYLKDTPHIDLKFKNQNLKNNNTERGYLKDTPEGGKGGVVNDSVLESVQMTAKVGNYIAPADVAAGRSMPNQESARKVQVETQAANDDKSLVEGIKANFKDIAADLELFKVGNQYGLRKKSKYSLIEAVRASEVVDYLASLGIVAQVVDYNQHYPNEEVI